MYLKALELQGFKSFPEKTRLTFEKAVTAVVGPNGSGKSNIADALQWVMGEQSTKALRGGKMEDVIFGGTEKRGQLGFAEVSLILDNTDRALSADTDEVQVTRRYYRSGDSEYYINRKVTRLRDVNELFMDTGLGKDGYSIIGQGKIDSILSVKSTDRREIFEEAAGISRYRHRKEEAERKLGHAEDDLMRVNDKISELEMQVEPLRKQSEVAKRYLILRDELRGLEISLWTSELDNIAERTAKLEVDAIAANAQLAKAHDELEKLYKAGEEFSERMQAKDVEAEQARALVSAAESKLAEAESAIAVFKTELTHNAENISRINEELKDQEGRDSTIQGQIGEHRARVAEIADEMRKLDDVFADISRRSEELSKNESETELNLVALNKRAAESAEELSLKRAELSSLAASIQETEDRSSGLIAEINAENSRLEEAERSAVENRKALNEAKDKAQSLKNVMNGYELRLKTFRERAERAADKYSRLTMDLNALRSRISMLTEMEKDYEGYSKAVKVVMREASRGVLKGIHGPAGELLKTGDEYALAIETAMGPAMQNIIVASEESGKAAINLLKRTDTGRVTCRPMSVIKGRILEEKGLDNEDGFEGLAIDLISFDPRYKNIYADLLGRTAVVDTIDSAIRIAGKYSHRFRIVTLDGQVMNAGGSMTGGSASKGTGILSRANELKTLKQQCVTLEENTVKARETVDNTKRDLASAEYESRVAADELRVFEDSVLKLEAEKEHYALLCASLEEHIEALKAESGNVAERTGKISVSISETQKKIKELEALLEDISAKVESGSGDRSRLSDKRRELLDEEAKARADRASLEAERDTQLSAVNELDGLRKELSGGMDRQNELLSELRVKSTEILSGIEAEEKNAVEIRSIIDGHRNRLAEISEDKMRIEAERTKRDRETQEKNREVLDLERENGRLEQRRQAAGMEEKQIIDRLWENYELSRSAALEQRQELDNVPAAKRRAGELKREMSSLGTPNIGAIDEFERVNTRYTYLTDQRDDIERSRMELLDIISDITEKMEGVFATEFEKIDASFRTTFTELFQGGKAAIELEDPNDILNSGIEIKVQPPGKSLKTITLLSGGEKAFVAIALYFAILKVKPTSFVVMDEIEAALDEANVLKMSNYMRNLSDKTQFIAITHRRGTMESADVLYGVTMQEQGVSRVLKIDLEEAEKTIKN